SLRTVINASYGLATTGLERGPKRSETTSFERQVLVAPRADPALRAAPSRRVELPFLLTFGPRRIPRARPGPVAGRNCIRFERSHWSNRCARVRKWGNPSASVCRCAWLSVSLRQDSGKAR